MSAGKINLQANDGKVLGLYAPDGMGTNTDIVPASVNGDATKTFKVSDAVNPDEAVSKAQLDLSKKITGFVTIDDNANIIGDFEGISSVTKLAIGKFKFNLSGFLNNGYAIAMSNISDGNEFSGVGYYSQYAIEHKLSRTSTDFEIWVGYSNQANVSRLASIPDKLSIVILGGK